jgi:16S rRNA U516 pseudouridylate synthase RsuA-like enzyme
MEERLQKIISDYGLASRRAAEKLIEEGRITVNGVKARLGMKADPVKDIIKLDGRPLEDKDKRVYIMLNKPAAMYAHERREGQEDGYRACSRLGTRVYLWEDLMWPQRGCCC